MERLATSVSPNILKYIELYFPCVLLEEFLIHHLEVNLKTVDFEIISEFGYIIWEQQVVI